MEKDFNINKVGILVEDSWIPRLLMVQAITIRDKIHIRKNNHYDELDDFEDLKTHERIHVLQWREMVVKLLGLTIHYFYLWYVIEWILRGFRYWKISLEAEAYYFEIDEIYIKYRKPFKWKEFLNRKESKYVRDK